MAANELAWTTAYDLASMIRRRRLSPVELTETLLRRIEQINPRVNAYCTVAAEQALDSARAAETAVMGGGDLGLLHGVPVSLKDLTPTRGIRTTLCS